MRYIIVLFEYWDFTKSRKIILVLKVQSYFSSSVIEMSKISKVYWKRKINKIQDSLYVCIPKEYANKMGLAKGDYLNLSASDDGALIILVGDAHDSH